MRDRRYASSPQGRQFTGLPDGRVEASTVGEIRVAGVRGREDGFYDFATKYDPQPFHLSDEAAAQTHFGRISASGWHTSAMVVRMPVGRERKM